jgi:preprotein translocase subunit Sss1
MTIVGISGATLVAIYLMWTVTFLIAVPAALAAFFVFAYNLELFDGRFHNAGWFGVSWGGLTTFASYFVQATELSLVPLIVSVMSSLVGMSIVYLTHKFRPDELSKKLQMARTPTLEAYSRYSRKTAWGIVKIECYAMIILAIGMIIPKIL